MRTKLVLLCAMVIACGLIEWLPLMAQSAAELVTVKQRIPRNFNTYSLFLVCNPQWLDAGRNDGLYELYRHFQTFGRAIGDENVAIWFWKSNGYDDSDAVLARIVDVERSVRFCKAWKLT